MSVNLNKSNLIHQNRRLFGYTLSLFIILNLLFLTTSQESSPENPNQNKIDIDKADPNNPFEKILSIRLRHIEGLEKVLNETDLTYMAYFFVKDSENSKKGAEFLSKIAEKLDFLAGILLIDCEDFQPKEIEYCQKDPQAKDGFPKMVIFKPPEYRINPYTREKVFHSEIVYDKKEVSEASIYNFITSHILDKSVKLNTENIDNFLNNMVFNKVLLFTDKTQTPLLFRGLSSFYYDRLLFGVVDRDQTALLKRFKIKNFPTLLTYVTQEENLYLDEPRIEPYKGNINSRSIVMSINKFALPEKLYLKTVNKDRIEEIKYKTGFKKVNKNDYMEFLEKFKSKRFLIYFSESDHITEDVRILNKQANGFFSFIQFDCSGDNAEFCKSTFKIKALPELLLVHKSVYNENKLETTDLEKRLEKTVKLSLDYKEIVNEIINEFPSEIKDANPQNFGHLISNSHLGKRIPIIYFHNDQVPIGLHLLALDPVYKKYIDFIQFESPTQNILKNFQFKTLPATIFMIPDSDKPGNAKIVQYNEELVYSRLRSFIDQTFNVERNTNKMNTDDLVEKRDLEFFQDNKKLKEECLKANKKLCVFGLLDGRINKQSQKSFENSFKILENVLNKHQNKPYSFGWVNATCHEHFASTFNIYPESIPNIVFYIPNKDLFARFFGSFDVENINNFIEKVIQGKIHLNKIKKENVKIPAIRCEDIKEYNENLEEDEVLKEFLDEQKRKREEEEREQARLLSNEKAKQKKKKKNEL